MSNFYKISLAALVAAGMVVFGASNSFAEVAIKGAVDVGFGQKSSTPAGEGAKTTSSLDGHSQANLDFSGSAGSVSAKYRLRVREDSADTIDLVDLDGDGTAETKFKENDMAATRHHVHWQVNEQLGLTFMGRSFGIPGSLAGHMGVGYFDNGYPAGGGHASMTAGYENSTGLDIGFNLGNMAVGIAILDDCALCGGGSEQQTMVPHFNGTFGAIGVGVKISSGSAKSGDTSISGSETQIGGSFATDAFKVGLQITSAEDGGKNKYSWTGLAAQAAGVEFKYVDKTVTTAAGADGTGNTDIAVGYRMSIGDGASMVPAYASNTDNPATGSGKSTTWMGVQVGASF